MNNQDSFDATQRVPLDANGHPTPPAPRRRPDSRPRPTPAQRAAKKRRQQNAVLIILCLIAMLILGFLGAVMIGILNEPEEDNGLICDNIYAAGENLGGLTPEEAKIKLEEATKYTYTELDMTISVLDTTVTLSPADTEAKLDVDAVVNAAFQYGRTGSKTDQQRDRMQAQLHGHTISVLPYLNLNTDYIRSAMSKLGAQYSTMLTQSHYRLEGVRPPMDQEMYDTSIVYQNLILQIGTAEYHLNTNTLYQEIMDAYEINRFQVTGECSVLAPDELDYTALFEYCKCINPVDAKFNTGTYEITKEVYGYGFSMEDLKAAVASAKYGDEIRIPLRFIAPNITSDFYAQDIFQNLLGMSITNLSSNSAWNVNVRLACELLDGRIIRPGDEFSFNTIIGQPTSRRGFQTAGMYMGKTYTQIMGAGLCQVASALYHCALQGELDIVERHAHSFASDFIATGFDAEVYYDSSMDFRFRNNTNQPIMIEAEVVDNEVRIRLVGTDSRTYRTELQFVTNKTFLPETVYNTMVENNAGGYKDGDVLREGITGYTMSLYAMHYDWETGELLEEILLGEVYYAKQDQVVVKI